MTFTKVVIWGGAQSVIRLIAGLAATKVLSIYLGPTGLALFSQFQTLAGLLNNFVNGGIQHGIVKRTAELRDHPIEFERMSRSIAALSLAFPFLMAIPLLIFRTEIAAWLFKQPGFEIAIVVYACTLVFTSVAATLGAQLTGLHRPLRFFAGQSAFALISLALVAIVTPRLGLSGALLTIPLAQIGLFFVVIALCKGVPEIRWRAWQPRIDRGVSRELLGYGALLFVSATAAGGSQLWVRDLLISARGAETAGHWQAVVRISEALIIIITSVLTSYYLPKLSAANRVERNALLRHYLSRIIPAFAAVALIVVALREPVVLLLFTQAFLPAGDLFAPQLAGDVVRMVGWIANIALLAAGRTRLAMLGEISYAAVFIGLASIYIPAQGPAAATYAYLAANIVTAIVLWGLLLRDRGDATRMPPPGPL